MASVLKMSFNQDNSLHPVSSPASAGSGSVTLPSISNLTASISVSTPPSLVHRTPLASTLPSPTTSNSEWLRSGDRDRAHHERNCHLPPLSSILHEGAGTANAVGAPDCVRRAHSSSLPFQDLYGHQRYGAFPIDERPRHFSLPNYTISSTKIAPQTRDRTSPALPLSPSEADRKIAVFDPVLGKREDASPGDSSPSSGTESRHESKEKRKRVVRRRTRTGCLTCRKRRIKCDERKPFCFNCEKSKKVCAGYEQVPYGSRRYRYMQQPKPQEIQVDQPVIHLDPAHPRVQQGLGEPVPSNAGTSSSVRSPQTVVNSPMHSQHTQMIMVVPRGPTVPTGPTVATGHAAAQATHPHPNAPVTHEYSHHPHHPHHPSQSPHLPVHHNTHYYQPQYIQQTQHTGYAISQPPQPLSQPPQMPPQAPHYHKQSLQYLPESGNAITLNHGHVPQR